MLVQLAFLLAALVVLPATMYLLYRSIVPYEPVMPDFRLAAALFYPGIFGFALAIVHIGLDPGLVGGGFGSLAYLGLYPAIESYALVVVFNRTMFLKQPEAPVYFGVGGGALAGAFAFVETTRVFLAPGREATDAVLILAMLGLATALVLFHSSKGLLLGTYVAEGARTRGLLLSIALELPFGALLLTSRFLGADYGPVLALMIAYAVVCYFAVWNRFFPKRMPDAMRQSLEKERKRVRRVVLAKRRK